MARRSRTWKGNEGSGTGGKLLVEEGGKLSRARCK